MEENNLNKSKTKKSLKPFFIKLVSISIAIVIVINLLFNLIFAERFEKLDKILLLDRSKDRTEMMDKIRSELNENLNKENIIYEEDKILLYKLFLKLRKEFQNIDKSKL